MIIQDTGENYTNYFGKSSVLNSKVAAVTSDGVTHTATMQAGYTGTFQWQVNGVDVVGETGATFKPVPSLPSNAEVNVVVTSLVYTPQGYKIVSVVIASVADNTVTAADGTRQLVDTTNPLNVIPLSTGRGLSFDGTQSFDTGWLPNNSKAITIFKSLTRADGSFQLSGVYDTDSRLYLGINTEGLVYVGVAGGFSAIPSTAENPAILPLETVVLGLQLDGVGNYIVTRDGVRIFSGNYSPSVYTSTFSIGVRAGATGLYVNGIVKDCYALPAYLSEQQTLQHFNNPEKTLYWESGVLKSDILSQAEIDDLQGGNGFWYPLTEISNTGYVRNHAKPMPDNLIKNADFTLGDNGDWVVPNGVLADFDTINKLLRVTTVDNFASVRQNVGVTALEDYVVIFKSPLDSDKLSHYYSVRTGEGVVLDTLSSAKTSLDGVRLTDALVFNASDSGVSLRMYVTDKDVANAAFYPMYLAKASDYGVSPIINWANSVMRIENLSYGTQSAQTYNDNFGLSTGLTDKYLNLDNDTVGLTAFADLPVGDWAVDLYTSEGNKLSLSIYNADLSLVQTEDVSSGYETDPYILSVERDGDVVNTYTNGVLDSSVGIGALMLDGISKLVDASGGKFGSLTFRTTRTDSEREDHVNELKSKYNIHGVSLLSAVLDKINLENTDLKDNSVVVGGLDILGLRNSGTVGAVGGYADITTTIDSTADFEIDVVIVVPDTVIDEGYLGFIDASDVSKRLAISSSAQSSTVVVEVGDSITPVAVLAGIAVITIQYVSATNTVSVYSSGQLVLSTDSVVFNGIDSLFLGAVKLSGGAVFAPCINGVLHFNKLTVQRSQLERYSQASNLLNTYRRII